MTTTLQFEKLEGRALEVCDKLIKSLTALSDNAVWMVPVRCQTSDASIELSVFLPINVQGCDDRRPSDPPIIVKRESAVVFLDVSYRLVELGAR